MVQTLHHRGPDDHGVWAGPGVGLAQARLSILDLSPAGHQPMRSADGRYFISFNGEIYNFLELREVLSGFGYRFHSGSDTEVLLAAWAAWGPACLERLNGMFAFALWDSAARTLTLARDRFGIKPLYYGVADGQIAFGSEIKAVLAAGLLSPGLEEGALHEYLYFGTTHGSHTLFRGVKKLLAGTYAVWQEGELSQHRWWFPERLSPLNLSDEEATYELQKRLERAVRLHLISDVPVGLFLSGGVDSSALATLASRMSPTKLHTFTAAFSYTSAYERETEPAARLAAQLGTEHHELEVNTEGLPEVMEALIRHHDQPFGDAAHIPLYLLTRALGGAVKVVLQGDGGDEIFAGYPKYIGAQRAQALLAGGLGGAPAKALDRALSALPALIARDMHVQNFRRKVYMLATEDPVRRMGMMMSGIPGFTSPLSVLRADLRERVAAADPFHRYAELWPRHAHLDLTQQILYLDAQVLLADWFLEKVDRSTMAHSVEVRVPFLDSELATWAMRLPVSQKMRGSEKKWLLRRALRGIVPDATLDAPKKGFGVPFLSWIAGPLEGMLREELSAPSLSDWLDPEAVRVLLETKSRGKHTEGILLYRLLQLALFKRVYRL